MLSNINIYFAFRNHYTNIFTYFYERMAFPPSPFPFDFTPRTTNCPVLCTVLFNQQQPPQLARLKPPLLRVKINSIYTVCQETADANVALRLLCLRPKMRCFCLTLIQFMYVSKGSMTDPAADNAFLRTDQHEKQTTVMGHQSSNPNRPRKFEEFCHHGKLSWLAIACLVLLVVIMLALLLGFLKASLVCCRQALPKWKYDYLQPMHTFNKASW